MINRINLEDLKRLRDEFGVSIPAIKAIAEVESSGDGYLHDERPKILFEAHWFSRLTDGAYDITHPSISSSTWDRKLYAGGEKEYDRLNEACELDEIAALQSTSWGTFQIMGFNYLQCKFPTVSSYVHAMHGGEYDHYLAFFNFCLHNKLLRFIQSNRHPDWHNFAFRYNGPQYSKNRYAERLEMAFLKYALPDSLKEEERNTVALSHSFKHIVERGDTMWGIAKKYNMTLAELLLINPHVVNANHIRVGQKVKVELA